jgi:hypothetical protein
VVRAAEENITNYCKALTGKTLFSAIYGTYTVALKELKSLLKASTTACRSTEKPAQDADFQEVRKRKRHNTTEAALTSKKAVTTGASSPVTMRPKKISTHNFFAPLRAADMDTDSAGSEASTNVATAPGKTGRPPPIILTSAVNLIQLQKQLKGVVSEDFKFRNTRNELDSSRKAWRISNPSSPTSTITICPTSSFSQRTKNP